MHGGIDAAESTDQAAADRTSDDLKGPMTTDVVIPRYRSASGCRGTIRRTTNGSTSNTVISRTAWRAPLRHRRRIPADQAHSTDAPRRCSQQGHDGINAEQAAGPESHQSVSTSARVIRTAGLRGVATVPAMPRQPCSDHGSDPALQSRACARRPGCWFQLTAHADDASTQQCSSQRAAGMPLVKPAVPAAPASRYSVSVAKVASASIVSA